jgi:hypothetical protein
MRTSRDPARSSIGAVAGIDGIASTTRDLMAVSPEVVRRIDVRKDGGEWFFGFRAANGVILVTTRPE